MMNPKAKFWKYKVDYAGKGYLFFNYKDRPGYFSVPPKVTSKCSLALSPKGLEVKKETNKQKDPAKPQHSCINLPNTT